MVHLCLPLSVAIAGHTILSVFLLVPVANTFLPAAKLRRSIPYQECFSAFRVVSPQLLAQSLLPCDTRGMGQFQRKSAQQSNKGILKRDIVLASMTTIANE
jgi:hypothetical protein